MAKENSLKRNAVYNIVYTLLNIVFPLIMFPYVSRCLSATGIGKVTFYTSISNYAIMIGALGISTYGIRKVAQTRSEKKQLSKTIEELFLINMFASIVVVCVIIALGILVPKLGQERELFIITIAYVVLAPLSLDWAYAGLEQYEYITKRSFACKTLALLLIFLLVHNETDYIVYALIIAFSVVSAWLINFFYIFRFMDRTVKYRLEFKIHLKPMILLFSSLLAVSIYTNVDTIMLGFIAGDEQVGYYTIATKVKNVLLTMINAISAVMLPRMSYYAETKQYESFRVIIKKSILTIMKIAIPCTVFFELCARETVWILAGQGYENSISCMQAIIPVLLVSGFSNITGNQILIPNGGDKAFLIAVASGAGVDIILNIMFMPKMGAFGAAVATMIAEIVQMGIQTYFARHYLKGNINLQCMIKMLAFCSVCAIFIQIIFEKYMSGNYIVKFMVKGVAFWGIYLLYLIITKDPLIDEVLHDFKRKKTKKY